MSLGHADRPPDALLQVGQCCLQLVGHHIKGRGGSTDFVLAVDGGANIKLACPELFCGLAQHSDRSNDLADDNVNDNGTDRKGQEGQTNHDDGSVGLSSL